MKLAEEVPGCMASEEFESTLRVFDVASAEEHDQKVEPIHQDCAVERPSGNGLPFHMSSDKRRKISEAHND